MSFRILSNNISVHEQLYDHGYFRIYALVMNGGRSYHLARKEAGENIDFYDTINCEKKSMFGSPFTDVDMFYYLGDVPYLLATVDKNRTSNNLSRGNALLDIEGMPYLGFGGPIYEIRQIEQDMDQLLLNGAIINDDGKIEHNVFENGGKRMFPSDFEYFGYLNMDECEISVQAKRKHYDDLVMYNTDGYCELSGENEFYRVARHITDQGGNELYICQKEKYDHLMIYDQYGYLEYLDIIVDESLIERVDSAYISIDGKKCYFFDEDDHCLNFNYLVPLLEKYSLTGSHSHVLDSINNLQITKDERMEILDSYRETILCFFDTDQSSIRMDAKTVRQRLDGLANMLSSDSISNLFEIKGVFEWV